MMLNMKQAIGILILLLSFLMVACGKKSLLVPSELTPKDLTKNSGLIIGSYTTKFRKSDFSSQQFFFKTIKNGRIRSISSINSDSSLSEIEMDSDYIKNYKGGDVFAYLLPEGKYHFYGYRFGVDVSGYKFSVDSSNNPYSIEFEVRSGEILYLGEIELLANNPGHLVLERPVWRFNNEYSRDIGILRAKYPKMDFNRVKLGIPNEQSIESSKILLDVNR